MRQSCATAREDSTTKAIAIESGTAGSVVIIEGKRRKGSDYILNLDHCLNKFKFMMQCKSRG